MADFTRRYGATVGPGDDPTEQPGPLDELEV